MVFNSSITKKAIYKRKIWETIKLDICSRMEAITSVKIQPSVEVMTPNFTWGYLKN